MRLRNFFASPVSDRTLINETPPPFLKGQNQAFLLFWTSSAMRAYAIKWLCITESQMGSFMSHSKLTEKTEWNILSTKSCQIPIWKPVNERPFFFERTKLVCMVKAKQIWVCFYHYCPTTKFAIPFKERLLEWPLNLFGIRGATFIPFSFIDQILWADFFSKIYTIFGRWKLTSIGLFWHPAQLIESIKSCP